MAKPKPKPVHERAARALCLLDSNPPDATMDGKPLWMDYLPEVRAVLQAIREPDEAMIEAASHISAGEISAADTDFRDGLDAARAMVVKDWLKMIDAVLGEAG
ncbi:hypothetical protein [Novosphingobium sp. 9]|uniref:hypothetical protein n=1 Tax=Novosphingobium sp. 9 TaxID=2025349 RepID=UPI0021B5D070|nr:hypothetical protein [Novosphingobium sp. 9]